jgi:hypothetical protein
MIIAAGTAGVREPPPPPSDLYTQPFDKISKIEDPFQTCLSLAPAPSPDFAQIYRILGHFYRKK